MQTGPCCNTATGQLIDVQDVGTCNAMPGHLHTSSVDQTNMMQLMGCLQNSATQSMEKLQEMQANGGIPGMPPGMTLPGMALPGGMIPGADGGVPDMAAIEDMLSGKNVASMEDLPVQCCSIDDRAFVGVEAPAACRARGDGFVPETPETLEDTKACRSTGGGGGGGGSSGQWDKEDYEENITHAGMESWKDENKPTGFTSWGPDPKLLRESGLDLQVTFRSADAHTGQWSMQMKPVDILPQMPPEGRGAAAAVQGKPYLLSPSGALTCKNPCAAENPGMSVGSAKEIFGSLSSDDIKSHVCFAYKGFIGHQDALRLSVSVFKGSSNISAVMNADITESASDWVEMAFPLQVVADSIPKSGKVGIGAYIVPRANGGMPGLGGWDISPFSDVKLDSIHFCSPVDLIAYKPEVIAGAPVEEIAEGEEDTMGVQTFVNLDNDDEDPYFDRDDTDGVASDDELVRLKMTMPSGSFGDVEFRTNGPASQFRLWDDASKNAAFKDANKEMEVLELLRTSADGKRYEREVWVEAIEPSTTAGDISFEFIFKSKFSKASEPMRDRVVFTGLGVETIAFEAQGNGEGSGNATLKRDPNWPTELSDEALRVFPGKPWEGSAPATDAKNKVTVKTTLNVVPVRPVKLYFGSFDVDDPTANDDEVDDETSAEDNRGDIPRGRGLIVGAGDKPFAKEFKTITEEFEFQVTRQPGDNFRIAASGDEDYFRAMENDDQKIAGMSGRPATWIFDKNVLDDREDPAKSRLQDHDKYVSPVLTVWRRFYLEVDHMQAVNYPVITGTVLDLKREGTYDRPYTDAQGNPQVQTLNKQRIFINRNLASTLPETSKRYGLSGFENSFDRGKLSVAGNPLNVIGSTAKESGFDEILVGTPGFWLSDAAKDKPFELTDDDGFSHGDALPKIDLSRLEDVFAPAYILPMVDEFLPGSDEIPFMLNAISDKAADLKRMMAPHFKNRALDNDPDFWIVYLQNGYQGSLKEDGDGEAAALSGQTDNNLYTGKRGWGAIINQESAREAALNYGYAMGWRITDVAPHEIGHLFGGQHSHDKLMSEKKVKSPVFDDLTLDAARSRENP